MSPFLSEEDYNFDNEIDGCVVDHQKPSTRKYRVFLDSTFFKDDRKFFILGGTAAFLVFCVAIYVMYSNSKPLDLDDLPVIQADVAPFKIKPGINNQVSHQDKIVYDNISGDHRAVKNEKIAPTPEEIIPISESEKSSNSDSTEQFSSVAQIDEVGDISAKNVSQVNNLMIVEEVSPPIKKIDAQKNFRKNVTEVRHRQRIKDLVNIQPTKSNGTRITIREVEQQSKKLAKPSASPTRPKIQRGNIMIQMAVVKTKAAAEAEYKRIVNKNKFLKNVGKKISKVDLGKEKGVRYKIQAGPYRNAADAKKAVNLMKSNGFSAYIAKKI